MRDLHAYARLGAALIAGGAVSAPVFYFIAASPALTALAFSTVLLGVIALLLEKSLPQVPPQAAQLLLRAGLDNLAGLLEELGARSKALYLPSRLTSGKPMALIPLGAHLPPSGALPPLPSRMLVETGPGADEVGLLVSTPGTTVRPLLEGSVGASSSELETALARVLVGALDLARGVAVSQEDGRVTVEAESVRLEWEDLWIYDVIGSPVASVVAAVVADGLDRPVRILDEHRTDRTLVVHLEVAP